MKKKLFALFGVITLIAVRLWAQNIQFSSTDLTGGVASNVSSTPIQISKITFTASGTNTTVKLYDSSSSTTNIVRASYGRLISYTTNYTTTFTNEGGVVITNTFTGRYTTPSAVAAVTNERPVLVQFTVLASSQKTIEIPVTTVRGLTAVSSSSGTLDLEYSAR